ncbi:MAG: hypothetical protein Q9192_001114 [Flavoplaca navasiana]
MPQRTGGILPPLSKYYYGPAVSPDRTPVSAPDNAWNAQSPQQDPPALPPRQPSTTTSASPSSQQPIHYGASVQQINLPGPPPTAPPTHPVATSSYNPNNYRSMPDARLSPNATWTQSSTSVAPGDTSTWGVNYQHNIYRPSQHALKPPLPPRVLSSQSQNSSPAYENKTPHLQQNGSVEFLRPIAYSPAPSPLAPQEFLSSVQRHTQQPPWQSEPQRLPPPPPPKIHNHAGNSQDDQPEIRPLGFQESDETPQTGTPPQGFGARHFNNSVDRLRHSSDGSNHEVPQDHTGDAFVSPQSTGSHLGDDYRAARHSTRKDTMESDWSVSPGTIPPLSGQTAIEPSPSLTYNVHDRSTLPKYHQDSQMANDASQSEGQDLQNAEGTNNGNTLTDNTSRRSEIKLEASPSTEQEVKAPSAHGEGSLPHSNNDYVQRDDSFYWHSPQTSASTSNDRDQNRDIPGTSSLLDATPEPQEQYVLTPPQEVHPTSNSARVPSPIKSTFGSSSASALGLGGPSDWEHFDDYDGEEVDDIALYLRPRSPTKKAFPIDTPELSSDPAPVKSHIQEPTKVLGESTTEASPIQAQQSMQCNGSQTEETTQMDFKVRSTEGDLTHPEEVGVFEQMDSVEPNRGVYSPSTKKKPGSVRNSTPKLPELDFEQNQEKSEPKPDLDVEVDSAKRNNYELNKGTALETQTSKPPALRDKETHVIDQSALLEVPLKINNTATTDIVLPPLDDQTRRHINLTLAEDVATTQANYRDQPRQNYMGPHSDAQDSSKEGSSKRASLISDGSAPSKAKELNAPYADLDSWAKASLNRYITMLHEEARASTDLKKLDLFKAFSRKEWKLRAVLYGAEEVPREDLFTVQKDVAIQRAHTLDFRRPSSKALPALPSDADRPQYEADHEQHPSASPTSPAPTMARQVTAVDEGRRILFSGEDSPTAVDTISTHKQQNAEEETTESYSPGGRPIRPKANDLPDSSTKSLPDTSSRHGMRRSTVTHESKPAYTPFRYSQGYVDDADQPLDRRASFRPYAALKLEPVEDHAGTDFRLNAENPRSGSLPPNASSNPHGRLLEKTASSDEQTTGTKPRSSDLGSSSSLPTDQEQPLDLRRFEKADFDPLIAVLPLSGHIPHGAVELANFQRDMNAVADDFGFIHQHVVAWDTKTKKIRAEHDQGRQSRQTESEQRIDALFNDDEIGYGDISELEEEFKRAEAARKIGEDRAEYSTFVEEVFNVVWTRLHFEIDQLTPLYDEYTSLAHETLAGKEMFEAKEGQYALAPTMSSLLTIHQKLEIRHQKAFEAVLERDRRLKKTEVTPWYTLGNVAKVKQLEKQFDDAEKKAIVEYCKQRDDRANRLMDVLDQNTLRGVGANQDYMEAVMKAVRRIASGRAFASAPANEPGLGMEEVIKAKAVTAVLASSSEHIVQTFHVADMLLNAADYELSVATAKLAHAESATLERLKDERTAEDAKLMRDLQHRLALIREDSRRTNDEIAKLLCFLGVQGGHAQASKTADMALQADAEHEHEQRLQKALEDAKRRNTQKGAVT